MLKVRVIRLPPRAIVTTGLPQIARALAPVDAPHAGDGATTSRTTTLTFALTEFEMQQCRSALSMILRVGSTAASLLTDISGRTVISVKLYLPPISSSRPSASLAYSAGVSPRDSASERNVSIMQVLTDPTSNSSGAQMFGSPLNSGGLPTMMAGFSAAWSRPRRAELQIVLAL